MIYARNQYTVPVGKPGVYGRDATFFLPNDQPASKLTVRTYNEDVVVEVSETSPATFSGDIDAEMELKKGFESLVFVTPITGFRFRSLTGIGVVSFRAYG